MQLNCKTEDFVADKSATGEHILPGSRYIGKMKVPSGCTNAAFLAAVYDKFKEEGGMNVIGSCPSVGVTGFILNGGYGDVSPYAGLGSDVVDQIEMVLYDGRRVNASATENEEIFWASKGGSGGLGVITNFWARIIQNPSPTGRFTYVSLNWKFSSDLHDEEQLKTQVDIVMKFQEFLSENPKSPLFGGNFGLIIPTVGAQFTQGVFLGSAEELVDVFSEADLLRADFLETGLETGNVLSTAFDDGELVCSGESCSSAQNYGDKFPPIGMTVAEYDTQAEAQAAVICRSFFTSYVATSQEVVARSNDLCDDFDIPQDNCFFPPGSGSSLIDQAKCTTTTVTQAILKAANEPQGFFNRFGVAIPLMEEVDALSERANSLALGIPTSFGRGTGGLILPTLQRETFEKLFRDTTDNFFANHLVHGAPLQVPPGSTGYPHRNAFWNTPTQTRSPEYVNILLQDPAFNGDIDKLQIYGNYNPSPQIPNYEKHVYVNKVEELACICTKVDPLGGFDSPRYPQRSRNFSTKQQKDLPCVLKKNNTRSTSDAATYRKPLKLSANQHTLIFPVFLFLATLY